MYFPIPKSMLLLFLVLQLSSTLPTTEIVSLSKRMAPLLRTSSTKSAKMSGLGPLERGGNAGGHGGDPPPRQAVPSIEALKAKHTFADIETVPPVQEKGAKGWVKGVMKDQSETISFTSIKSTDNFFISADKQGVIIKEVALGYVPGKVHTSAVASTFVRNTKSGIENMRTLTYRNGSWDHATDSMIAEAGVSLKSGAGGWTTAKVAGTPAERAAFDIAMNPAKNARAKALQEDFLPVFQGLETKGITEISWRVGAPKPWSSFATYEMRFIIA